MQKNNPQRRASREGNQIEIHVIFTAKDRPLLAHSTIKKEQLTMRTNEELKNQAEEIFQRIEAMGNYTAVIRAMENSIYEVGCLFSAIDQTNPKAEELIQHVTDLTSLTAILRAGYESGIQSLSDKADQLNIDMLNLRESRS